MASQKTYDYILIFKSQGHKLTNWVTRLMLLFAIAALGFLCIYDPEEFLSTLTVAILVAMIGWWIFTEIKLSKGKPALFRIALIAAVVAWAVIPGARLLAMIYFIAALLEKQVKFPQEIAFDNDEIVVNSFPRKHYTWSALNNVVLKDGILTIDFKNNKLIQKELESYPSPKIEQEFNEFCSQRLS